MSYSRAPSRTPSCDEMNTVAAMHGQHPKHDTDQCPLVKLDSDKRVVADRRTSLRNSDVDSCSKAHFLVRIMDYYFVKKSANPDNKCQCPMLRCRLPFNSVIEMIEHVKHCNEFQRGESWCVSCNVADTFPVAKPGHCPWKDTLTQKLRKSIEPIMEHVGRRRSGQRSPTPANSNSSSSPPPLFDHPSCAPQAKPGVPEMHIQTVIDSQLMPEFINFRSMPELSNGTVVKRRRVAMQVDPTRPGRPPWACDLPVLYTCELPASLEQNISDEYNNTAGASPFELSSTANTHIARSLIAAPKTVLWSSSGSSRDSHSLSSMQSDIRTNSSTLCETISSRSSVSENHQCGHPAAQPISYEPSFSKEFTDSPAKECALRGTWQGSTLSGQLNSSAIPCEPPIYSPSTLDQRDSVGSMTSNSNPGGSALAGTEWYTGNYTPGLPLEPIVEAELPATIVPDNLFTTHCVEPVARESAVQKAIGMPDSNFVDTDMDLPHSEKSPDVGLYQIVFSAPSVALTHPWPASNQKRPCKFDDCVYEYEDTERGTKNYARHIKRKHTGDQEYFCDIEGCSSKFINRKDNLLKHQRLVHGVFGESAGVSGRKLSRSSRRHPGYGEITRSQTVPRRLA
jgi:hypothetical protein